TEARDDLMTLDLLFKDIGILLLVATFFGFVARAFKQPLIPAYVVTGLLLGPVFNVIGDKSLLATLSEMGIAFLLFMVGMEIDLRKIKSVGRVMLLGGLAKSLLLFGVGFLGMRAFGFTPIEAVYVGIVLSFSSTMVVVKILSDRRELDTLQGKLIVGYLLLEDVLAILALSLLHSGASSGFLLALLWKGGILVFAAVLCHRLLFPALFRLAAQSTELLFVFAISVCFFFALLAGALGFSVSIGAFVGGLVLANLPYTFEVLSKVRSVRDFFSTLFFVALGMSITAISEKALLAVLFLFFAVWVLKTRIVFGVTAVFGYKPRPAFMTAIALAQTSEFSFIIAAQGLALGHLSQDLFSLITIITVITMGATSYFMTYQEPLSQRFSGFLRRFDAFSRDEQLVEPGKKRFDALLVGYDRMGYSILRKLTALKRHTLVVDYNPSVIRRLTSQGVPCFYGDISEPSLLEHLDASRLTLAISTSPNLRDNETLIHKLKQANPKCRVFVTALTAEDALELYSAKADYVIVPHFLGGDQVSLLIERFSSDFDKLISHRTRHLKELEHRNHAHHS
ncbi:MAG: cation:proton antiporter, partial [Nanoarchaeota archaeon]|nr:cation:proton antiporter [Nanoarchaeota archaeon]